MPIIDLQRRMRQLGEIRIGHVVDTGKVSKKTGKPIRRPEKLQTFRLTSPSEPLLEQVAELYGGTVGPWTPANGGPDEYEVYTDADRLPIIVPPEGAVDQWYELYQGSRCVRRCDGRREQKTDQACLCDADQRECAMTTRLNVMLRDVRSVGLWLLTTHGYYAATELPPMADLLARAGGYVTGWLTLELKRVVPATGPAREFMVPKLDADLSPAQLLSGQDGIAPAVVEAAQARAALTAAATLTGEGLAAAIEACEDIPALTALLTTARAQGLVTPEVLSRFTVRRANLEAEAGHPEVDHADPERDDPERVWTELTAAWPGTMSQLDAAFAERHGGLMPSEATAPELRAFLAEVRAGRVRPSGEAETLPF